MAQHPDWDIEFKPAIAGYDWDQTYDVLEFVYLPQGFDQLMDRCGIPAFGLMAIDRFTPYRYRWADQYSDVVYEFLKAFNFSPHNSIKERYLEDESGAVIKDSNRNIITVPNFELENPQTYNYEEPILANFSKGKYQITGLIYQSFQEGLVDSIRTINQAFVEFTLAESTEIDLNKILWNRWLKDDYFPDENDNRFCSNSLVISKLENGNWVNYTPSFTSKPTWLLYSDINTYFNNVKQQLIDYFQRVYVDFISIFNDVDIVPIPRNITTSIYPLRKYLEKIEIKSNLKLQASFKASSGYFREEIIYNERNLTFKDLPSYFLDYCSLHRANNNKWSMQTNYSDLGIKKIISRNIENVIALLYSNPERSNNYGNFIKFSTKGHWLLFGSAGWARPDTEIYKELSVTLNYPFYKKNHKYERKYLSATTDWSDDLPVLEIYTGNNDTQNVLERLDPTIYQVVKPDNSDWETFLREWDNNEDLTGENILLTQQEWEEICNYEAMTDQEYLDYLLQLKAEWEEQDRIEYEEDQNAR